MPPSADPRSGRPPDPSAQPPSPQLPSSQPLRFLNAYWAVWQGLSGRVNGELLRLHGLDLRAFIALSYVQGAPTSPGELARVLDVPRYEMTRILDRLTGLQAITRTTDPANARSRRLEVTLSGQSLWDAALQTVTTLVQPSLQALGPGLEPLTAGLERLASLSQSALPTDLAPKETP
ncbi:MarR family winged helix-turn-helix transcriptional regulator [Deinococcus koreensis]|uniref:MarR family winged helix-turn-helix transcriptional regulator n=1 Tax=Deinococcus koreensis TaxID=2054903 RepID=UPI0013FE171F|nr:MarR family transcriptional regulator [Deinococcus koreensis]